MSPSSGSRYMISLITLFAAVTVKHTCAKLPYGAPCTQDKQCQHSSMFLFESGMLLSSGPDTSQCKKGRCNCNYDQRRKFTNNNYECHGGGITALVDDHCKRDDPNSCINGVCEKDHFNRRKCTCSNGSTQVEETCREILSVGYGEDCKTPASGPVPICDYDNLMHCNSAGICDCYSGHFYGKEDKACMSPYYYYKKYPANLNEPCGLSNGFPSCNEEANMTCEEKKCLCKKGYFYSIEDKACIPRNDYVKKYPYRILNLHESCPSANNSLPKLCNEEAHMICEQKSCKCTIKYYPVESDKTCHSKKSYAEAHDLPGYKVMPGIYCSNDTECITGLDCYKNKCACPYPCTFDNKTTSCDCGEISAFEGASRQIVVGVIGGFFIILFWSYTIHKTLFKGTPSKSNRMRVEQNDEPPTASHITTVPLTEPYRTVPLTEPYRIRTTTGASPPTPVPAQTPTPPHITTVPLTEPYRISTTIGPSPTPIRARTHTPPPSYSSIVGDAPASTIGFSSPTPSAPPQQQAPYTGAPTPNSFNPEMPPASDTSPSTIPYPDWVPVYASTSVSIPSSSVKDSPVPGVAPDYVSPTVGAPTYSSGDTTAPPPYNPNIETDTTAPLPVYDIYKPIIM